MVAKNPQAHITKSSKGWQSKITGNDRASFTAPTQAEAYAKQRDSFKNGGGGEISVHRPNGQIRDKNTISPMKDYCPPKG
jgi:hypothetical protein